MSRKLLQFVNGVLAVLTIVLATLSLTFGIKSPVYGNASIPEIAVLDSNLRFFGGLALGIGLILLWITPSIEKHTNLFRSLWICAFLGGIGRVVSMLMVGLPPQGLIVFTWIEVILAPVIIFWQWKVSTSFKEFSS